VSNPKADTYVVALVRRKPVMAIPHFLLASYHYYVEDDPILSDWVFDDVLVKTLLSLRTNSPSPEHLGSLHVHSHLIPWDGLEAGSGFMVKYPERVVQAAQAMRRRFK